MFLVTMLLAFSMASCLLAGVFLAFSDFLMRSFDRAARPAGTEAMQVLNRVIYRALFMALFIGMVPISLGAVAYGVLMLAGAVGTLTVLAGVLYLVGVFGVTAFGNVPLNGTLDAMPLGSDEAQVFWPEYLRRWTRLNHIRSVASLAAAICYAWAAVLLAAA